MLSQVIKENKIQVYAKREEKTTERLSKSKFNKEYELSEKIDTYSLTGGLTAEGRLIIAADVKAHAVSKTTRADDDNTSNDQSLTVAVVDRQSASCVDEQSQQLQQTDDSC